GIPIGIFDKGLLHGLAPRQRSLKDSASRYYPPKQRPCPLKNRRSVYHLTATDLEPTPKYVSQYTNSDILTPR
ncbi:MAG TPA: hypothetical protein VFI71_08210, partial [Pyrinomonadaceae bacterium]|nr:hypothetical protein [Pyrinomonadaceae bacterium]